MKKLPLLPNKYKRIGSVLLGIAFLLWIYTFFEQNPSWLRLNVFALFGSGHKLMESEKWFTIIKADMSFTILGCLLIAGGLLVGFSKEKVEDEFISNLRLNSLMWAVLITYGVLLLAFITIYGFAFLNVMGYHIFLVLIIFIVRFNYLLYKSRKGSVNEE